MTSTGPLTGQGPMSFAQRRLWFLQQLHEDGAYNNFVLLRVSPGTGRDVVVEAVGRLVERHEMLRTVFRLQRGVPTQVVLPAHSRPEVTVVTLAGVAPADDDELRRVAVRAAATAFRLDRDLPLRVSVIESPAGRLAAVVLVVHHIVWDAESKAVVVRELDAACDALARGEPWSPEPLDADAGYLRFAAAQHERHAAGGYAEALRFWRGHLEGLAAPPVDPDRGGAAGVAPLVGSSVPVTLDGPTTDAAQRFAHGERATLFVVLALGWFLLLRLVERRTDLVTGIDVSERDDPGYAGTVGLFVNQIAVRADLGGDPTLLELGRQVRRSLLEGYEHKEAPLDLVVRELQLERAAGRAPLFENKLYYVESAAATSPTGRLTEIDIEPPVARHELSLGLTRRPGGVTGYLNYREGVHDEATCAAAAAAYPELVARVATRPQSRLREVVADVGRRFAAAPAGGR